MTSNTWNSIKNKDTKSLSPFPNPHDKKNTNNKKDRKMERKKPFQSYQPTYQSTTLSSNFIFGLVSCSINTTSLKEGISVGFFLVQSNAILIIVSSPPWLRSTLLQYHSSQQLAVYNHILQKNKNMTLSNKLQVIP